MKHEDFDKLLEETITEMKHVLKVKGGEYAGDEDRFQNFKRNAQRLRLHQMTIWAVYFNKHIDAINQYVQDLQHGFERPHGEAIESRFVDAMNYLMLGLGMLKENNGSKVIINTTIAPVESFGFISRQLDALWFYIPNKGVQWLPWPEEFTKPVFENGVLSDTLGIPNDVTSIRLTSNHIGKPTYIWERQLFEKSSDGTVSVDKWIQRR